MASSAITSKPVTGGASPAIETRCIDTIRTLAMDAVEKANSGHPGTPMALAPLIYTLWQRFLRFDPSNPLWPNRDRFVLSNGHASMLLYATLHLAGVTSVELPDGRRAAAVSLADIKRFRQLGSPCPGHPEYGRTAGVETTTGPLGQGCGTSVGMALAARWLGQHFNRPGYGLFDYRVFAVCSDGDMMEGVTSEAASFAGHQRLSNLCWIYDNNRITIEGDTDLAFDEDVASRFRAYGWNVERVDDVNDTQRLAQAIERFEAETDRPTLIIVTSHIGFGAPHKQDTNAAHGEALGEDEVRLAKLSYGWPQDAQFFVPDGVREQFAAGLGERGPRLRKAWDDRFAAYCSSHPRAGEELMALQRRQLPKDWAAALPVFASDAKAIATRNSSGKVLNAIAARYPWLIGGAADLAPSTKTTLSFTGAGDLEAASAGGRNLHFGVREHAMGAILNGLSLSGLRAFGASFLIFSDYMKAAIRLAALMELPVIYVFTHDSIGLGEDGPTHQPIEQLIALRTIPGLITLRPADANEVIEAWRTVIELTHQPACLVLSRQAVPTIDRGRYAPAASVRRGAYVLADTDGTPEVILIGSGSEVSLCLASRDRLSRDGIKARVVSMPSWELFEQQEASYRDRVLPPQVAARVSVEMGSIIGWDRYVGRYGERIGMRSFGASAPLKDLLPHFGFTVEAIVAAARKSMQSAHTR
ncbi:MAG TPA: transketolase [Hyphomicrobiaceae bacterium]|nr:transketolase [Hyphomicrobiaceae bacterium]